MPKAKAAAQKAVDADPTLAEAYTSRAFVRLAYDWDWLGAQSDFQQALKLNSEVSDGPSMVCLIPHADGKV